MLTNQTRCPCLEAEKEGMNMQVSEPERKLIAVNPGSTANRIWVEIRDPWHSSRPTETPPPPRQGDGHPTTPAKATQAYHDWSFLAFFDNFCLLSVTHPDTFFNCTSPSILKHKHCPLGKKARPSYATTMAPGATLNLAVPMLVYRPSRPFVKKVKPLS